MLDSTLTDGVNVSDGVEEHDKVGDNTAILDDFRTEHLELVGQGSRQPLLADVVALLSDSFGGLTDDRAEVRSGTDEDDNPVLGGDGADELSSAPE